MRATRLLIHLDRLRRNIGAIRNRIGSVPEICLPVKADAYGHGAPRIAQAALEAGVSRLAVAAVSEGAELRREGIEAPILLLSLPAPEELGEAVELGLIPLVNDREFAGQIARAARQAGKRLPVHLKIDTGMGRLGCRPNEAVELAAFIAAQDSLEYAGTATHLAVSDDPAEASRRYTGDQLTRFRESLEAIRGAGLDPGVVHAANSGAILLHPGAWFNMVRPGLLIYGYSPIPPEAPIPKEAPIPVEPVMELRTRVACVKRFYRGESVSYGRTWIAPEDTFIAVLPVGYGDGLPRSLSGNFSVLIRDAFYPLAGRICMDQCMVNLGPEPAVTRWDEVTVFGGAAPGADAPASILNTIPYEITCNMNKRLPRVYPLHT
ncbi:MAG: alanine racemase [Treponema sp.]|jgi:alanine racemase|nr:alanine racemase [Treponema sp.]